MSRDARRKEKQRLKRKRKQVQARKASAVTPLDRLANGVGRLECWVNDNWRETGMASVQVLGTAPDGRCAWAGFLIDVWCVGLKDAFGFRTVLRGEFEQRLDRIGDGAEMADIPVSEAKRLVVGGIRFSRRNGFKLPPHYERWLAIFADVGDVSAADLTGFGVEGGMLRYVGDIDFLRRRLAGCSVEQFLGREDVQWMTAEGIPQMLLEEGEDEFDDADEDDEDVPRGAGLDLPDESMLEELAQMLGAVVDKAEDAARKWCFQTGRAPHPRLRDALDAVITSAAPTAFYEQAAELEPAAPQDPVPAEPQLLLGAALASLPEAERRDFEGAVEQVSEFLRGFGSPEQMFRSMGLPDENDLPPDAPPLLGGPPA